MKVRILRHTSAPKTLLAYTKATRLTLGEETEKKIDNMTPEQLDAELDYMAQTIPSSWEFVDYIFEITGVSRGFTHQFVRTRQGSYAQQTMRILNVENFEYVTGPSIEADPKRKYVYDLAMSSINYYYQKLIMMGVAIEDARGVLPTNIKTNIIAKFNLRTLSEMCKKRTGGRTQGEYQDVMNAMADAVLQIHPWADRFLFPKGRKNAEAIEELINRSLLTNTILSEEATKFRKALDKLKE